MNTTTRQGRVYVAGHRGMAGSAIVRRLLDDDQLAGFEVSRRFYEIGSPEGIRETESYLLSRAGAVNVT